MQKNRPNIHRVIKWKWIRKLDKLWRHKGNSELARSQKSSYLKKYFLIEL